MSFFLGAYATSPNSHPDKGWNPVLESNWFAALRGLSSLRGLELPFHGHLHPHDDGWLLASLPESWDIVLTLLPGTMERLAKDRLFGLASDDETGRRQAIAFTNDALTAVQRLNDAAQRRRVVAVELHSAPRRGAASTSAAALGLSLSEIAGWEWQGARLTVEHCDAWCAERPAIKGFLRFEEELAVIGKTAIETGKPLGLAINWGRSALEARDAAQPLRQIAAARQAGLLSGLMFSGCSAVSGPWGRWQDSHMPPASAAEGSLLTRETMAAALAAAGPPQELTFLGGKVSARPDDASLVQRLWFNQDLLSQLELLTAQT